MSILRINSNLGAQRSLTSLGRTERGLATSLERLSTGLRIVRPADDPSGLVVSEQLRGQITALRTALENNQQASNLIATAESALAEISGLLTQIKDGTTFALSQGGASADQIQAEQDAVDAAIAAIDQIVSTTRFGQTGLLNGASGYRLRNQSTDITNLQLRQVTFAGLSQRTFSMTLVRAASQAVLDLGAGTSTSGTTTIRVTGELGSRDITLQDSATATTIARAVNDVAAFTGVYASATAGAAGELRAYSTGFGDAASITLDVVGGALRETGGVLIGPIATDLGTNAQLRVSGQVFDGQGLHFSVNTPFLNATFDLSLGSRSDAITTTNYTFRVEDSGLKVQIRENPVAGDQVNFAIGNLTAAALGFREISDIVANVAGTVGRSAFATTNLSGGFLNSLKSGGTNDLTSDPGNAGVIVDGAVDQVAGVRGFLGAVEGFVLQPNLRSTETAIENLAETESTIRDLDFARETAEFARQQILFQSGLSVVAASNLLPQRVLSLLA